MVAVRTEEPLPTTRLVVEVAEAECRRVMAVRAGLSVSWVNRITRAELLADVDALLDEYLALTRP